MTRKDFILISSAIRAAKEGLLAKLPKDTPIRQAMLNSIELSALHIGKALLNEQGARFDFGRFLTDCGYGATTMNPRDPALDLRPLPEPAVYVVTKEDNGWSVWLQGDDVAISTHMYEDEALKAKQRYEMADERRRRRA